MPPEPTAARISLGPRRAPAARAIDCLVRRDYIPRSSHALHFARSQERPVMTSLIERLESDIMTNSRRGHLVPLGLIERKIYVIRGHKVMLSPDLAALYQVESRTLVQAVKRNSSRFP